MTTDPAPRFGALLKSYRRAAGLTQEALAEQAHLSVRGIQDLERGVSQTPRPDTVALLAAALGLSAEERTALLAAASPVRSAVRAPEALIPLVGRQRELALLTQFLASAGERGRTAPLLLLAGEPGIGKTRLLQAVAQRAAGQGWGVLEGGCHRRGGQEPYAPLLDALAQHLHAQPPARRRAALVGCAWLVRLLPELAEVLEPLPPGALAPQQERRLLFAAVSRLLANVAGPAGTLLVLDDLQWMGPDALDLLATLVRTPATAPLRIVGAYRDTEVRPVDALGLLLADLAQAGLVRHHMLGPLAAEEAAVLLADLLGGVGKGAVAERVLQRAGGTPFFLVSYAQALRQGSVETVPWDLAQGVRQRVALLPEVAQGVLGAAAIVGRRVPRALLAAATGQGEEVVLAGLETACRARLLLEEGDEAYAFAHDVIREVVEADLGAGRRMLLHRRVGRALEAAPGAPPVARIAYHYAQTDDHAAAALWLERAGDEAVRHYAHAVAGEHYAEARRRRHMAGSEAVLVAGLDEKLGLALRTAGQHERALTVLEQVAEAYQTTGDREGAARAVAGIGQLYFDLGRPEAGLPRLQPVLAALEGAAPSPGLAALHDTLAWLLYGAGRYRESRAAAVRAAELARLVGDERIVASATRNSGYALLALGQLAEARPVFEDAVAHAEVAGDLEVLCRSLNALNVVHLYTGDFTTAARYSARALETAKRLADPALIALLTHDASIPAFFQGDWGAARQGFERALTLYRALERPWAWGYAYALAELGWLALAEGRWEEAEQALDESIALAERMGARDVLRMVQPLRAELDLGHGQPARARARLLAVLEAPGQEELEVIRVLPTLAWAYLELGDVATAREAATQAIPWERAEDYRLFLPEALRVRAMVAVREGRQAEAEGTLEEGLALARHMRYPYAEARLLHVYGELNLQTGAVRPARKRLEAALAIFRRLGARWDAAQVERTLAGLGAPGEAAETNGAVAPSVSA